MSYTGINLESVKNNNRSAILKLLNDQRAMSRKDIANNLGLTPATVSVICADLLGSGVLCELGELQEGKRAGRKKVLLGINYNRCKAVAISIESGETCICLTNLKGEDGLLRRIRTDTSIPPEEFLARVAHECEALIAEAGVERTSLLGVGVSVPGIVSRGEGVSTYAYRVWNEQVKIRACLQELLELPVIVENNVRAFAEAELIYGSGKDWENMLFVKWGPGVGSSIVIHKQIYDSNRSQNAEIGHFIVKPKGKLCRCGRRGCLETIVGTHAMADQLRDRFSRESMPLLYGRLQGDLEGISAHNFTACLESDDPGMWEIVDQDADLLARSVCNVITMLAPDQVIIYGKLFDQPHLRERFLDTCAQVDGSYDKGYIILSELSEKIDYIGPLAVVVNELFLSGQA